MFGLHEDDNSSGAQSVQDDSPMTLGAYDFGISGYFLQSEGGKNKSCREQLAEFMERPDSSNSSMAFHLVIVCLILGATANAIIQTIPSQKGNPIFSWIEAGTTMIFTVEVALNLIATDDFRAYVTNWFNILDILAILPGYLELVRVWILQIPVDARSDTMLTLRVVRVLRVFRILRLAKVARHMPLIGAFIRVISKIWVSGVLALVGLLSILTVFTGSLVYLAEIDRCDEMGLSCQGFDSIPSSCWFAISTLSTVGYGDEVPATLLGQFFASMAAIIAVLVLALGGALMTFDLSNFMHTEMLAYLSRSDAGLPSEDGKELLKMMCAVQESCNNVVSALVVQAARQEEKLAPPSAVMLRSLEHRGQLLCNELQRCVFSEFLGTDRKELGS